MKKGYSKMPPMMPGALGMPPPMKAAPMKQKPKMPAKKRGR